MTEEREITRRAPILESWVSTSSWIPSTKKMASASLLRFSNGSTAIEDARSTGADAEPGPRTQPVPSPTPKITSTPVTRAERASRSE